jgi:hypothetical protein
VSLARDASIKPWGGTAHSRPKWSRDCLLAAGAEKHRRRTFASRRGRSLADSAVGSIKETQEMFDF